MSDGWSDILWLRGGERLVGRVLSEDKVELVFESRNIGQVRMPRDRVERIDRVNSAEPPVSQPPAPDTAAAIIPSPSDYFPWSNSEAETWDWIRLKSGEWLKGRMKSLQDEKLEFDSEKLDLRKFDWDDVKTVFLPGMNSVWFGDRQTATGSVFVNENEVRVVGATTNSFSRANLAAVTPTGKKELDNWSGKVSAGVTLRSGNVDQVDYNAQVTIDRRTPSTHLNLSYLGNYAVTESDETANNHRFTGQFDYFLSRRLFVRLPFAEYYRDPLQNLAHRITLGGGAGYDLIQGPRTRWNVAAGPAYQRNWYESVGNGERDQRGAAALVLSSHLDVELTERIDFVAELRSQITSREAGETTHHGLGSFEFEIHKLLDLDLSFIWDRVSRPKADADGVTPERDDFRVVVGVGIDF